MEREIHARTAPTAAGTPFLWPEDPRLASPETTMRILGDAADKTGSNLIRWSERATPLGRTKFTNYIYLGRANSDLFEEFSLREGRWFTPAETHAGDVIVSSQLLTPGIIGLVSPLGAAFDLAFEPLIRAFDTLPSSGLYVVDSPDMQVRAEFFSIVKSSVEEAGVVGFSPGNSPFIGSDVLVAHPVPIRLLPYMLAGLAALIMVSILFRDAKKVGVMRLLGHSFWSIWMDVVGRLHFLSILVASLVSVWLVLLLPGVDIDFVTGIGGVLLSVAVGTLAVTVLTGSFMICRMHINTLLKGYVQ